MFDDSLPFSARKRVQGILAHTSRVYCFTNDNSFFFIYFYARTREKERESFVIWYAFRGTEKNIYSRKRLSMAKMGSGEWISFDFVYPRFRASCRTIFFFNQNAGYFCWRTSFLLKYVYGINRKLAREWSAELHRIRAKIWNSCLHEKYTSKQKGI